MGRGAAQILLAGTTLRVRLVAPLEERITATSQKRGMTRDEAKRYVEKTDQDRFDFVNAHFHKDLTNPEQYDLVLNSSRFSAEDCAGLIIEALHRLSSCAASIAPGVKQRGIVENRPAIGIVTDRERQNGLVGTPERGIAREIRS